MSNFNEFFGLFKKNNGMEAKKPIGRQQDELRAFCPFCNDRSAIIVDDLAYYPSVVKYWHCTKCNREWNLKDGESPGSGEKGYGGTFLSKDKVAHMAAPIKKEHASAILYLSGLISEEQMDINQVASQLQFMPTTKKKLVYNYVDSDSNMPPMTYTIAKEQKMLKTPLDASEKLVKVNDVIVSGPSRENYSIDSTKFSKLYVGQIGGPIHPEQSPRNVAFYNGKVPVTFSPSWGGSMVLEPGDYLVKEGEGKYYRIARKEYEMTYNPPGKMG